MDENFQYSLLEDPEGIFQCTSILGVAGMANTNDGSILFVYCSNKVYSWDPVNNYSMLHTISNITGSSMNVDAQNNLYAIEAASLSNGEYHFDLAFFNASESYSRLLFFLFHFSRFLLTFSPVTSIPFLKLPHNDCYQSIDSLPWNGGVLFGYVNPESNCSSPTSTVFMFFDPVSGVFASAPIPELRSAIVDWVAGSNNDIWVSSHNSFIYYFSMAHNAWTQVSLSPVDSFSVMTMVWNAPNNDLLLYLHVGNAYQFVKVSNDVYPPQGSIALNPGPLGEKTRATVVSMKQANSDNYGWIFLFVYLCVAAVNESNRHLCWRIF